MKMTVIDFKAAAVRYVSEYKLREMKKKSGNNWATAGKRIDLIIKMLDLLGDILTLDGFPMSANAPYILNIGDVAEMVMREIFNRANGYGHNNHLSKSTGTTDIDGKGGYAYEVKFEYNSKYKCTALNATSTAKDVYFMTAKAVYKIPYAIALASEEAYGNDENKHRHIVLHNIANVENYILKTYTEILYK